MRTAAQQDGIVDKSEAGNSAVREWAPLPCSRPRSVLQNILYEKLRSDDMMQSMAKDYRKL